jgi:hypothetical protein
MVALKMAYQIILSPIYKKENQIIRCSYYFCFVVMIY